MVIPTPHERFTYATFMLFDQYSRYRACADLLRDAGFGQSRSVLDIGSGSECLFGQFLPDAEMSYVDPLISISADRNKVKGDVFSTDLDGRQFDYVTAVDVLEHVPAEYRQVFLWRLSSLGRLALVLAFPAADTPEASELDEELNRRYRSVFGKNYSWLDEHFKYGLPSLEKTVAQLENLGWHCKIIGHGHVPWLRELLGFTICTWDVSALQPVVEEISREWNQRLYSKDFRPPFYRWFVVASRYPIPNLTPPVSTIDDQESDRQFRTLMEKANSLVFRSSLRALKANEEREVTLQLKLRELSDWGECLQNEITLRDKKERESRLQPHAASHLWS
jgi:hypothetical protein